MIRILVADDQAIIRDGLVTMLDLLPDIEVVGEAADGAAAVESATRHRPDVVLMDLRMPGVGGTRATAMITAALPSCAVLVLTTYADDSSISGALAAGARGYLTKDATRDELAAAIRSAAAGQVTFAREVGERLARQFAPTRTTRERFPDLTPREAEVLEHVAAGRNNTQIASTLYLSVATVKSYTNDIYAKLGARDRAHAIAIYHGDA
ncbi:response regulator transcription factor [Isoptericola sp. F-RaC21]|uniref:response regulator transcription factor n=1 Tax=Isoptericola sp. F-RaC21 TaxID=3141452 RepID=UPI00315C35EB